MHEQASREAEERGWRRRRRGGDRGGDASAHGGYYIEDGVWE